MYEYIPNMFLLLPAYHLSSNHFTRLQTLNSLNAYAISKLFNRYYIIITALLSE